MIEMKDITFFYTVGGYDVHYDNMFRCMRSIKRTGADPKFLILEFGNKLSSNEEYEVLNLPDAIDFNAGKKVGYLIWKHKYIGALHVKTKYGIYVDSDTVMAGNYISKICEVVDQGIGVTQHFWVPNIDLYEKRACTIDTIDEFLKVKETLGLESADPFFAGGIFIFANNDKNRSVMEKVLEYYSAYYDSKDYVRSITDELFLAAALKNCSADIKIFGGGLNHCSMGEQYMPMAIQDGVLYGKNPYEKSYCPVSFLHCDVSRRDPSQEYTGEMKELIRKYFELDENE
jgi:hypothetical protein